MEKRDSLHNVYTVRMLTLCLRVLYVYLLLWVLRLIFWAVNYNLIGGIETADLAEFVRGALVFDSANMGYSFSLFIVLSLLPLNNRGLGSRWYARLVWWSFMVGAVLVIFLNLSDAVYFHFARKRFSGEEFHFASNDNNLHIIMRSILDNWYLLIPLFGLIWLSIKVYAWTKITYAINKTLKWSYYSLFTLFVFLAVGIVAIGIRGGIGRDVRPITLSNAASYVRLPMQASLIISNPFSIIRTIGETPPPRPTFMDSVSLAENFSAVHHPVKDSLYGTQRGKNVVILILESFSAEHSKFLYPDLYEESLTPFLDSLMGESLTFTNAYANGSKSIDALPSILASIPSLGVPFSTTDAALAPLDGLGHFLERRAYTTLFYNGSPKGSMGYDAFARLSGVQEAISMDDYVEAHGSDDYDGYWGIFDKPFLNYFASELGETPQPFFATLFTLTSHHPFVVPAEYEDTLPEGFTKIHKAVSYTDLSLRSFFARAAQQEWYDNTIFVLVGDHVSSETYSQYARTPKGNTHITYLMYTPDGSLRGVDSTVTQQIDVAPSLYHLLGREDDYFAFGSSVFDENRRPFVINYSMGKYQYITADTTLYSTIEELQDAKSEEFTPFKAFVQGYWRAVEQKAFLPSR